MDPPRADSSPLDRAIGLSSRIGRAWRTLGSEQRSAALTAIALFVSLFLPWYEKSYFVRNAVVHDSLSAFSRSFVAAALLLVIGLVLGILFARGERRAFHLPGGDGAVVLGAGSWAALLVVYCLFDKPELSRPEAAATVGLQWGLFVALAAAVALALAGARLRAAHRPEPPLPQAEPEPERPPPAGAPAPTRVLPVPERGGPAEPPAPRAPDRLF